MLGPSAILLAISGMLCSPSAAQLAQADWPQFGRAPDFRSWTATGPNASPKHKEWTYTAGSRVVASPAVFKGVLYSGSDDSNIFALNATTGSPIFKFATNGPVRSSPAVLEDGSVIAGSYDGSVYHLDASGKLLGSVKTGSSVYAPVSVANGTAYVGSMDKHLYAIDIKSFSVKWKSEGTNVVNSGTAVSADGTLVFTMDYSGLVRGVHASTGETLWSFPTHGGGGSSPVLDGKGTLYVGSWSEEVYALDQATGSLKWSFPTHGEVESHAAYHDGVLYVSAEESKTVFAIDSASGKQLWSWSGAAQELNGSPTLTPDLLYVGSNDHHLYCLSRTNGSMLFAVPSFENVFASAAVADDGWVYFADNTATLDNVRAELGAMARCDDAECAMEAARSVMEEAVERREAGQEGAFASPSGHVFAIDPSLHLDA